MKREQGLGFSDIHFQKCNQQDYCRKHELGLGLLLESEKEEDMKIGAEEEHMMKEAAS